MNNRKFVVARLTYTTYIKYFLFFCRNLYGRFSFGTQICFNALLEIIECNHFCGGGGCCTATENGHPPWRGNIRVPGSLVTSYFDSQKHFRYRCLSIANLTTYYQKQHRLAREKIFGITKRNVIPETFRCRKAWEAAVNLINGDREMEGKGKP